MIPNQISSSLIAEALEEINLKDLEGLCPTLQKLLNELMPIERKQVLRAAHYERNEEHQGYTNGLRRKLYKQQWEKYSYKFLKQGKSHSTPVV